MKKVFILFAVTLSLAAVSLSPLKAQTVAINTDGSAANASAMLDVKSTTKGMLIPRMTSAERTSIVNPAAGLLVYDNQTASFWFYKAVVGWTELVTGGGAGTNYWNTNGTHIYNNNTGNVGIGISNPLAKLHVAGNVKVDGANTLEFGSGIAKEGNAGKIGYQTFGSFNALDIVGAGTLGSNRKITFWNEGGAEFRGGVKIILANTLEFGAGVAGKEGSAGKIGYQTFTAGALDIVGAGTTGLNRKIKFWNEGGASFKGNVGIGTDNPTYKLSVLGNIRATEVVVETGWADYVFNNKYKLKPLNEVEEFIKQNNHLPGIPSAAEVEKNGLHLGDTQKKMMEKIEELTLYIIQLNKRIKELEKK